ncbi:MAG TPA: flagellar basal body P-ring protein FlgI [Pirellulales bacterium]|nr:flagellar basal body P-ring protein FlgI [Pirellulales bacterium]
MASAGQIRLVEAVAGPFGMEYVKAEGTALVVGLADTGGDPPPSPQRAELMADMQARGVINPNSVLASPTTALVVVRTFLPPAAQRNDPLDLEVVVPPHNDTTSIAGGWLMQVRLQEKALLGGGVHTGHMLAIGEGPILVDPAGPKDKAALLRGRVLGGGHVTHNRSLGLMIRSDEKSVYLSKQIGDAVNRRFHSYTHGVQEGVATPKTDAYIELLPHPRYKYNMPRYMRVVRAIAIKESPEEQAGRLKLLEKQLLDPVTSSTAALRLEAVGKVGIPVLQTGLKTSDPEVRFYSSEALAYLDDASAAKVLGETARNQSAFRAHALTALSALNAVESSDELRALLDLPSAETRYGAFRALWAMNPHDPAIQGEDCNGRFSYHALRTGGPPMVHVTRSFRAEVVTFGPDQYLQLPLSVDAGRSIVINGSNGQDGPADGSHITVSRFETGKPDQKRVVSCRLDDVIRAIVELDGTYPDVVQFLQQAKACGALTCRFEVDALPNPSRLYDRAKTDNAGSSGDGYQVATPVPNLFAPAGLPQHIPDAGS